MSKSVWGFSSDARFVWCRVPKHIVLDQRVDDREKFSHDRIAGKCDLALAGHTHGGQVRLPWLPPLWLPRGSGRFVEGWYEREGSQMYVCRGIGMSILPIRFFCRPELAVITVGER